MSKKSEKEKYEEEKAAIEQETKAVALKQPGELDLSAAYNPADWGQAELSSKDIVIPRIILMQPMSPPVTDGKAMFGEFRESLNMELLGKMEDGFEVIPFFMEKQFVEYKVIKKAGQKEEREYFQVVPITAANENLPYEDEVTDKDTGELVPISRDRTMNFYVLLKKELNEGAAIPYILSFRKTSLQAGKKLTTQMFMKNINAGKTPASTIMKIFARKESGNVGGTQVTYAVADTIPTGPTPDKMIAEAFRWLSLVRSGKTKAHEESLKTEGSESEIINGGAPQGGTGKF